MTGTRDSGRFWTVSDGFFDLSGLVILMIEGCGLPFGMQRYFVGLMVRGMKDRRQLARHAENFNFPNRILTLSASYGA